MRKQFTPLSGSIFFAILFFVFNLSAQVSSPQDKQMEQAEAAYAENPGPRQNVFLHKSTPKGSNLKRPNGLNSAGRPAISTTSLALNATICENLKTAEPLSRS